MPIGADNSCCFLSAFIGVNRRPNLVQQLLEVLSQQDPKTAFAILVCKPTSRRKTN
jgi:hypothetical protein